MPIYDYHCDHCGHTFSAVQSYTDKTLEVCPSCGKVPRKLMATPAIVFKGGGWYKTDSRPAEKAASKDGPKDGPKESKDGSKDGSTERGDAPAKGPAPAKTGAATADTPKTTPSAPAAPKGEAASS